MSFSTTVLDQISDTLQKNRVSNRSSPAKLCYPHVDNYGLYYDGLNGIRQMVSGNDPDFKECLLAVLRCCMPSGGDFLGFKFDHQPYASIISETRVGNIYFYLCYKKYGKRRKRYICTAHRPELICPQIVLNTIFYDCKYVEARDLTRVVGAPAVIQGARTKSVKQFTFQGVS